MLLTPLRQMPANKWVNFFWCCVLVVAPVYLGIVLQVRFVCVCVCCKGVECILHVTCINLHQTHPVRGMNKLEFATLKCPQASGYYEERAQGKMVATLITGLVVFAFLFAVNSATHSYLIVR